MIRAVLLIAAVLLLSAVSAAAQSGNCAAHAVVASNLADRWGEVRQSAGLAGNNAMVEVWANPETGTWSITVTQPGGPTCMVASGHAWHRTHDVLPPNGEPT